MTEWSVNGCAGRAVAPHLLFPPLSLPKNLSHPAARLTERARHRAKQKQRLPAHGTKWVLPDFSFLRRTSEGRHRLLNTRCARAPSVAQAAFLMQLQIPRWLSKKCILKPRYTYIRCYPSPRPTVIVYNARTRRARHNLERSSARDAVREATPHTCGDALNGQYPMTLHHFTAKFGRGLNP